jgi:hypothetical protein
VVSSSLDGITDTTCGADGAASLATKDHTGDERTVLTPRYPSYYTYASGFDPKLALDQLPFAVAD